MTLFPASNRLIVNAESSRWRLYLSSEDPDHFREETGELLFEASPHEVTYSNRFAAARNLLPGEKLNPNDISATYLGWAGEDQQWHLGVMIRGAQEGTNTWCGLARWPDQQQGSAVACGRALANALGGSLSVVPKPTARPQVQTSTNDLIPADLLSEQTQKEKSAPDDDQDHVVYPDVPLLPLPITVAEWQISDPPQGLTWERTRRWRNETRLRGLFFAILAPLFAAFSIGAIVTPYARVQPEWLPLIGIGIALIMLLNAIRAFLSAARSPVTRFDSVGGIVQQRDSFTRRATQVPYEGLEHLLISHVVSRTADKRDQPAYQYVALDVWIHLYAPRRGYIEIARSSGVEGEMLREVNEKGVRRILHLYEVDTPAHHAVQVTADRIGIPAYVEMR